MMISSLYSCLLQRGIVSAKLLRTSPVVYSQEGFTAPCSRPSSQLQLQTAASNCSPSEPAHRDAELCAAVEHQAHVVAPGAREDLEVVLLQVLLGHVGACPGLCGCCCCC